MDVQVTVETLRAFGIGPISRHILILRFQALSRRMFGIWIERTHERRSLQ
jgi:hypothetical protein